MKDDPLHDVLVAVCQAFDEDTPPLMVVGGYGLVLRARHIAGHASGQIGAGWARSTNDLDLLLSLELLASAREATRLADVIRRLGFVEHIQRLRFRRPRTATQPEIGIDLMAPDPDPTRYPTLRIDGHRVKAASRETVHGRRTDGAHLALVRPHRIRLGSTRVSIRIPHLFGFVVLKLLAYRDAIDVRDRVQADKRGTHAGDLLLLCAQVGSEEFEEACVAMREYHQDPAVGAVRAVVAEHFHTAEARGSMEGIAALRASGAAMPDDARRRAVDALRFLCAAQL